MTKTELLQIIAGEGASNYSAVARILQISPQAVKQWPEQITLRVLSNCVADYVRVGRRVPTELVQELRRMNKV